MSDDELRRGYQAAIRTVDRHGCPDPERLRRLVEREGSEAERLESLDHVMGCPACRAEFDLLQSFAVREPGPRRWIGAGLAAAIVVLAVGAGVWRASRNPDGPTRGSSQGVELLTPSGGTVGSDGFLTWRPVAGAHRYLIELRAEDGGLIARDSVQDTTVAIASFGPAIGAGSVYWTVVARLDDGSDIRSLPRPVRLETR